MRLINDILDISKIEAGKFDVQQLPCSPEKILAEVASLMAVRASAKQLSLNIRCDGPVPETILSDPIRLRQILINLVGNAIKFTAAGGIRVVVRLLDGRGPTPRLQFDVSDTGIGMDPTQIQGLFRPFAQVDSSLTRQFGGTGLGLAISKRLAEMLGGTST